MATEQQIEANRLNAQKSTGAVTSEGKEVSKYNAVQHGVLKQAITEEEKELYQIIKQRLHQEHKPQGILEEIILERIIINFIKLDRVAKIENELTKSALNPRVQKNLEDGLKHSYVETIEAGYFPKLDIEQLNTLVNVYQRYETSIENRLYRAIHELRYQKTLSR